MVKVIVGLKGAGKTKTLIDLVNKSVEEERGDVVCIEKDAALTYDIPHSVRLIKVSDYAFGGYEFLKGFISGLHAGNYDITQIFIDGLFKIAKNDSVHDAEAFLDWCEAFSEKECVKFTATISVDESVLTEGIKKYL